VNVYMYLCGKLVADIRKYELPLKKYPQPNKV